MSKKATTKAKAPTTKRTPAKPRAKKAPAKSKVEEQASAQVKAAEAEVKAAVEEIIEAQDAQAEQVQGKTGPEVIAGLEAAIEAKTAEIKAATPVADTESPEPPQKPDHEPRKATVVQMPRKGKLFTALPLIVRVAGRTGRIDGRQGRTGRIV